MKTEQYTWESLRSEWVNGNKKHVASIIDAMQKAELLPIIRTALIDSYNSIDWDTESMSGDLQDLIEILNFCLRGKI